MIYYLTAACLYRSILFLSSQPHIWSLHATAGKLNSISPHRNSLVSERGFYESLTKDFQIKVKLWIFQIMPSRHPASKVTIQETQRSHLYNYITFQDKTNIFF
ncbi:unnamed protein product [Rangifer tarandus platyrhynchus]|uniref:Uncharacterized protein n=1 Tax=Rangifer tarandus platyrhynchus TaxID=3082113 RepID=A0AC59YF05_RANTA